MNTTIDPIINQLLAGQKQLSEVSLSVLEKIQQEQPCFSLVNLLITKKMKEEKHLGFMQHAQKTAMFFPNVLWYQLMLQEEEYSRIILPQGRKEGGASLTVELPVDPVVTQPEQETGEEDLNQEEYDGKLTERLSAAMQSQLDILKQPVEEGVVLPIESESFHTVDYFASLGIKLDELVAENDQFVNKIKKFTDWLKQMKKVNTADLVADEAIEKAIQHIADKSNIDKDVVTETMAQAFIQQGKISRAIQIYSKLSFLNPAKSAYFAAKILELKDYKQ